MKNILIPLLSVPIVSALLVAQDTNITSPASGKETRWTGLLVAAGCPSNSTTATSASAAKVPPGEAVPPGREQNTTYEQRENQADRSSASSASAGRDRMARRTDRGTSVDQAVPPVTSTVTTPPVDDKGTRGSATQSTPPSGGSAPASGRNAPPTGVKDQSNAADRQHDMAMSADRSSAGETRNMDRTCYVGKSTNAFALKLKDGRMLHFDDASNSKIVQQLQSSDRLGDKVKIFRATVSGSIQGDTITLDTIQM